MAASKRLRLSALLTSLLLPATLVAAEPADRSPIWVPGDGPADWRSARDPYKTPDADGDGVEDALDRCPASRPYESVALDGCMAIRDSLLGTIRFTDNSVGYASSTRAVRTAVRFKRRFPHARLLLVGHAVDGGSHAQRQRLALRRANQVREALLRYGIDGRAILVRSAGADEPIAANDTAGGRAQNRRVEIRSIPSDLGVATRATTRSPVRIYLTKAARGGNPLTAQAGLR